MDSNEIIEQTNYVSVADLDDVNNLFNSLVEDVVPRNSDGDPEDLSGALGTSLFFWAKLFVKEIILGSVMKIGHASSHLTVSQSGSETERFGEFVIEGDSSTTYPDDPGPKGLTRLPPNSISNTSFTQITGAATITTAGRPVRITLNPLYDPSSPSNFSFISMVPASATSTMMELHLRVMRGGTQIGTPIRLAFDESGGSYIGFMYRSPREMVFFDFPSAGTHSYTIEAKVVNGSAGFTESIFHLMEI